MPWSLVIDDQKGGCYALQKPHPSSSMPLSLGEQEIAHTRLRILWWRRLMCSSPGFNCCSIFQSQNQSQKRVTCCWVARCWGWAAAGPPCLRRRTVPSLSQPPSAAGSWPPTPQPHRPLHRASTLALRPRLWPPLLLPPSPTTPLSAGSNVQCHGP